MPKFTFKYSVGPGTPAWKAFDRAETAYLDWLESSDRRSLKRYYNQRQYLIKLLGKHREPAKKWIIALDEAIGRRSA
jgi:hypothetical protein